ncbi:DUF1569 domain-containing protein [bacterium]|nr:DUF1569 domain-containing protein [bacterium]
MHTIFVNTSLISQMKTIFSARDFDEIKHRIEQLDASNERLWGKMDVDEMLCHCTDQIRLALGEKTSRDVSTPLSRTLVKWLVVYVLKIPRDKVPTLPEFAAGKGGTKPTQFNTDRQTLLHYINKVRLLDHEKDFHPHGFFGKLNRKQWGIMIYKHLHHHLQQFSA